MRSNYKFPLLNEPKMNPTFISLREDKFNVSIQEMVFPALNANNQIFYVAIEL